MKHILLSCFFAAGIYAANAQATAQLPTDGTTNETAPKAAPAANTVYVTPQNQWGLIDMKVSDNTAWFYHINGLSDLRVYVTDNEGRVQIDQKLGEKTNGVDVSRLRKGSYFVTLINQN